MTKSLTSISHFLERLSSLHRNLMRKVANEVGLQLVHVEILQYLSMCNRYSDTTQSISEYLGQTKGSISQSLAVLEEKGLIKRIQDKADRRVFHLTLTSQGNSITDKLLSSMNVDSTGTVDPTLKSMLLDLQKQNGLRSFGECSTCCFNKNPGKNKFICGITNETLSLEDIKKICREHEPS